MLPIIGAIGGMAVPAIIYVIINIETGHTLKGWAIPSATDIAFSIGVLSLLGSRIPTSLKVFLMALAILDDLGAIIIIAFFYSSELQYFYLLLMLASFVAMIILNKFGVKKFAPYFLIWLFLWYFTHESGIHSTISGVLLALTIPHRYAKIFYEEINFSVEKKRDALERLISRLNNDKTYDSIDMIPSIGDALTKLGEKVGYPKVILKKFERKQKIGRATLQRHLKRIEALASTDVLALKEYWLLKKAVESDIVWDEIVEIEEVKYDRKYVYDISVEGLETFTTFEGVLTHNTMRTFHYAGVAEINVTLGLPRMIEIVDARKEPSTPIMTIYLKEEYNSREKAEEIAK